MQFEVLFLQRNRKERGSTPLHVLAKISAFSELQS